MSVTTEEASYVRLYAERSSLTGAIESEPLPPPPEGCRLFLPIEFAVASGRAKCRDCGEKIERGTTCVAFGYDPAGGQGRLGRAYVHATCPEEEL